MQQVLGMIPNQKISSAQYWQDLRTWQKNQGITSDKMRWTIDFISDKDFNKREMAACLQAIRNGDVQKVVYMEELPERVKNLDWLAFACSCMAQGIAVTDREGHPLIKDEDAKALQAILSKASQSTPKQDASKKISKTSKKT